MIKLYSSLTCAAALLVINFSLCFSQDTNTLILNEQEYLEMPGLNVMLAHDFYPEGHQGGVGIIQNGVRVATNGDLRLEPTPGQWQPVPKVGRALLIEKNRRSAYVWNIPILKKIARDLIPLFIRI